MTISDEDRANLKQLGSLKQLLMCLIEVFGSQKVVRKLIGLRKAKKPGRPSPGEGIIDNVSSTWNAVEYRRRKTNGGKPLSVNEGCRILAQDMKRWYPGEDVVLPKATTLKRLYYQAQRKGHTSEHMVRMGWRPPFVVRRRDGGYRITPEYRWWFEAVKRRRG